MIVRILAVVLVSVGMTACAALDRTVDSTDRAGISRVAVTSALADEMNHDFVGTLIFENQRADIPVPQWQIPAFAEETLAGHLRQRLGTGEVQRLDTSDADRAGFASIPENAVRIAAEQGYDTVAIIMPARNDNFPFVEAGYGLYRKVTFGLGRTCAYQQTVVYIYDVTSRQRLAWEWGFNSWDGPCGEIDIGWEMPPARFSEEQMELIEAAVKARFESGLERAVRKLGFGAAS